MAKFKIKEGIVERQLGSTTTVHTFTGFNGHFNVIPEISGSSDSAFHFLIWLLLGLTGNHIELKYNRGVEGFKKLNVSLKFGRQDQPDITVSRQVNVGKNDAFYIDNQVVEKEAVEKLFASNYVSYISVERIFETMRMSPKGRSWLFQEIVGNFSSKSKENYLKEKLEKMKRKADEIRKLLTEVINPKLQNLMKAEAIHRNWKEEISKLERVHHAYTFHQQESKKGRLENEIRIMFDEIKCFHKVLDDTNGVDHLQELLEVEEANKKELAKVTVQFNVELRETELLKQVQLKTESLAQAQLKDAELEKKVKETDACVSNAEKEISDLTIAIQQLRNQIDDLNLKLFGNNTAAHMALLSFFENEDTQEMHEYNAKNKEYNHSKATLKICQEERNRLKATLEDILGQRRRLDPVLQSAPVEIDLLIKEIAELKREHQFLDNTTKIGKKELQEATEKAKQSMLDVKLHLEKMLETDFKKIEAGEKLTSLLLDFINKYEDCSNVVRSIAKLTREHKWINLEKGNFGKKGSMYDFTVEGIEKSLESAKILQSQGTYNGELVNANAETELKEIESQEDQHKTKLQKVMVDIDSIESEIKNRRAEKEVKLEILKKDFKDLSQKILPGRNSSISGDLFDEGIEIVSGGDISVLSHCDKQSQLLSLAFLLSLMIESTETSVCLVDEVDSGLDGADIKMIQGTLASHFPHIQFILLPLNPGILRHQANVMLNRNFVS